MSIVWIVFAGLFLAAAVNDARRYKIPNWISLGLMLLFAVAAAASREPLEDFWPHLAAGAAALAVGYALYAFTGMGAGDAKLGAAAILWSGPGALYPLAGAFAVAMALLAIGLIALRLALVGLKVAPSMRALQRGAPAPLGVAIAAAAIAASRFFDGVLWAF